MSKKRSKKLALVRLAVLPAVSLVRIAPTASADTYLYDYNFPETWSNSDDPWYDSTNLDPSITVPPSDGVALTVIGNGGHDIAGVSNTNVTYNWVYDSPGIGVLELDSGNTLTQSSSNTQLISGQEILGLDGAGTYTQSAGTNTVTSYLELGAASSGSANVGTYNLSGGTFTANSGTAEYIGGFTPGVFSQTGGTNNDDGPLLLGTDSGSTGTYSLSGSTSTLGANSETIGSSGTGELDQYDGLNQTNTLSIGTSSGSGTYDLLGGTLQGGGVTVGSNGTFYQFTGTLAFTSFSETGGTAQFTTGLDVTSGETCTLSGGSFTADPMTVGGGSFTQSGGTLGFTTFTETSGTVSLQTGLNLTNSSSFSLSGGSLTVSSITRNSTGSSNMTWSGGGSLTLTSQPFDITSATTDTAFGGFVYGSSLTLSSGMSLNVNSSWEYLYGSGSSITQNTGSSNTMPVLYIGATGTNATADQYTLNGGSLTVTGNAYIGFINQYSGPGGGNFSQTGGASSFGALTVGPSGPATVGLSGGTMTVTGSTTLYSGGVVNLSSGGSLFTNTITLGSGASSSNLHWSGGSLTLTNQYFDVSTTTDPTYGGFADGSALTLGSGMSLTDSARGELMFGSGSTLTQNTGSSNTASTLLMGSSGTGATPVVYNLTGGSLTVTYAAVGDSNIYSGPNAGTFTQSGGTSSFGFLNIGLSGPGSCTLSTGTMAVTSAINLYTGTFHQSGGTLSFPTFNESGGTANFDKGLNLTSSTVSLSGGTLTTASLKGPGSNLQWTSGSLTLSNQAFDVTTAASDPNLGGYIYGSSLTLGSGMSLTIPAASSGPFEFVFGNGSSITQNTGSSNAVYELVMGSSGTGTPSPVQYNMNGGSLTTTFALIGDNQEYTGPGAATFTQTNGTASIATLFIGNFGGASSYSLSSGSLIVGSQISNNNGSAIHQTGGLLTSPQTGNSGTMTQTGGTAALGSLTGTGSISVGGGSSLASTSVTSFTQRAISIAADGLFTILPNSNSANSVSTLSITGSGQLDLTNNHMFINYGSGPDPIASIAAMIASGNDGGTWRGAGIFSSDANMSYGIGYADSADPGNPAALSSGQIEIMFTLYGDANLDHKVNGTDFNILAANFNTGGDSWDQGDFTYDGKVNGSDFNLLAANFNQGASQADDLSALKSFAAANGLSADVPEPATAAMTVMAGLGVLARRRRR